MTRPNNPAANSDYAYDDDRISLHANGDNKFVTGRSRRVTQV